jgi:glycosyltransferase involved in cell wall biosynthesis
LKFTVLLSLYCKESPDYLNYCLQSIADNTLRPDQVIIVYDGEVGEQLEAVVDKYTLRLPIEVVRITKNIGLGNALNYGLSFSTNDVVIRMDTDDKCLSCRFEKQISYLEQHPQVVLLGSAVEEFDESMKYSQGIRFSESSHLKIKEYAKKRNPFNHMSVVFKKSVIEKVGGYQHHYYMEDYNLWLRVIASGYLTYNSPEVLVYVRAGKSMIGRRKGIKYILSEIKLANIKRKLKIDSFFGVITVAILRIIPRFLPTALLKYFYAFLRK